MRRWVIMLGEIPAENICSCSLFAIDHHVGSSCMLLMGHSTTTMHNLCAVSRVLWARQGEGYAHTRGKYFVHRKTYPDVSLRCDVHD